MSASRPRGESGIVFTLLRSGHTRHRPWNGNVPSRIPPVNAPATALPARPPVCSAPHFPLAPLTGRAETRASVLLPLRCHRTLAIQVSKKIQTRSITKNQKDRKGSPQSMPCKGPSALRVRLVKISTAGTDEPAARPLLDAGGSIFTGKTLTSHRLRSEKAILFSFSFFFFCFFFPFPFSKNVLQESKPTVSRIILYASDFVPLH